MKQQDELAIVVELACVTEDRTPDEQRENQGVIL